MRYLLTTVLFIVFYYKFRNKNLVLISCIDEKKIFYYSFLTNYFVIFHKIFEVFFEFMHHLFLLLSRHLMCMKIISERRIKKEKSNLRKSNSLSKSKTRNENKI
jgi:hypothetical protein